MIVLVKRGADSTPIEVGEGAAAEARIKKLVEEHGAAAVVNADGSAIQLSEPKAKPAAAKAVKKPAKAKKK